MNLTGLDYPTRDQVLREIARSAEAADLPELSMKKRFTGTCPKLSVLPTFPPRGFSSPKPLIRKCNGASPMHSTSTSSLDELLSSRLSGSTPRMLGGSCSGTERSSLASSGIPFHTHFVRLLSGTTAPLSSRSPSHYSPGLSLLSPTHSMFISTSPRRWGKVRAYRNMDRNQDELS